MSLRDISGGASRQKPKEVNIANIVWHSTLLSAEFLAMCFTRYVLAQSMIIGVLVRLFVWISTS